jgi:malonyl-CoA decarboxylase
MGNGAEFHRLNWLGNPSLAGMQSSAGMMVNYLYDLPALEANAERFRRRPTTDGKGESLALGPSVLQILRQP